MPGSERSRLLHKLADLIEVNGDRLAALEALNVGQSAAIYFSGSDDPLLLGKSFYLAKMLDVTTTVSVARYYAGWADKIQGRSIQVC